MEKPIVRALDCLERRDLEAAEEVVRENDYIDSKDLRIVITILHISVELERMGDYAEVVARINLLMGEADRVSPYLSNQCIIPE